jgi:hypothetical protein
MNFVGGALGSAMNIFESDKNKQDAKTRALYALLNSQDKPSAYSGFSGQPGMPTPVSVYQDNNPAEQRRRQMAPQRLQMAAQRGGFGPQGIGGAGFAGF